MSATQSARGVHDDIPSSFGRSTAATGACEASAIISAGVGAIHLSVAPEHLGHWWVYGWFFVVVGVFQLGFAPIILRRPSVRVAFAGIIANVLIVLVYVASRTVGLPIAPAEGAGAGDGHAGEDGHGPGARHPEDVGVLDLTATAGELVLVALLVSLLPARLRAATCNGLLALGLTLWALRLSGAMA